MHGDVCSWYYDFLLVRFQVLLHMKFNIVSLFNILLLHMKFNIVSLFNILDLIGFQLLYVAM